MPAAASVRNLKHVARRPDYAAGTLFAATGVSCRQQIAHGTERRALHPVELIRAALAGSQPAISTNPT